VIAGAGGVVGQALSRKLLADGWQVIGLARRPGAMEGVRWIAVDLTDEADARAKLRALTDATHIFCAARYNFSEGGREPLEENLAIVRNLVDTLDPVAPGLSHVHLVQGSKYYGSHLGPFPTPAREDDARSLVANFYYLQQDYLAEKQKGARWTWSASRPDAMIHGTAGIARNLVSVIAVYALISRELGIPLCFPGSPAAYNAIYECTSTEQLAEALAWMSEAPAAANQAYNIFNGDYIRWSRLWPTFAGYFGLPVGPVRTIQLADSMSDKGHLWDAIVRRHGLQPLPYERVALWGYADFIWNLNWDVMCDMTKARLHGFHRVVDTSQEFIRYFDELRAARVIP
jgi:nucleoside-diphosphate-sugar epimerase